MRIQGGRLVPTSWTVIRPVEAGRRHHAPHRWNMFEFIFASLICGGGARANGPHRILGTIGAASFRTRIGYFCRDQ